MKLRIPEMNEPATPSMGVTLLQGGFSAEALPHLYKAAWDNLGDSQALMYLGVCHRNLQQYDEAEQCLLDAVEFDPQNYHALHNLGVIFEDQGDFEAAERFFKEALKIRPEFTLSQQGVAFSMTRRGKFFDCQDLWELNRYWSIDVQQIPLWQGEPLQGKRIIVWREGGYGDHFLFWRYLELLKVRGAHVTFYGPKDLKGLLGQHAFIDAWLDERDELETADYDYSISLWSIPVATKTFPMAGTPKYISDSITLPEKAVRVIGICLQAGEKYKTPRKVRSLSADFEPYAKQFNEFATLISLQLSRIPGVGDLTEFMTKGGWEATVRLIASCDLVISVDTAVAHLAGAMGKPVWLLLNTNSCWCWFTEEQCPGGKSPWYPTMRIFRNPDPLDWSGVLERVASELKEKFAADSKPVNAAMVASCT